MKRFTFIIAALLIGSMCFAQNFEIKQAFKADKPIVEQNAEKSDWYGHATSSNLIIPVDAGSEFIINTSSVTGKAGATITKVKFKVGTHSTMPTYNGTSFTIKFYEKCEAGLVTDPTAQTYPVAADAIGNVLYQENYTATLNAENVVTLATPFTIPANGKFAVALKANQNCFLCGEEVLLTEELPIADFQAALQSGTLDMDEPAFYNFSLANDTVTDLVMVGFVNAAQTMAAAWEQQYSIQYFIEDGQTYEESSDIEVAFGQVTLSAQGGSIDTLYANNATINLAATEDLTYALLFQNRGNDVAAANTITLTLSVNGIPINDLVYPQAVAADGWGVLTNDTLTAELMDQQQLTGTFTITFAATFSGTDPNLENNTRTITVVRSETTSIDSELSSSVSVYPNPASDMFTVANAEGSTIEVYNALGQVVTTIENASANQTIDASNLSAGAYYVKVNAQVVKMNVVK